MKTDLSIFLRDLTLGWSTQRLQAFMAARIKSSKWRYLAPLPPTQEESEATKGFEWPILSFRTYGPAVMYDSPFAGPVEVDATKRGVAELRTRFVRGEFRLDKHAMRKHLRDALDPVLGRRVGTVNAGCWRYVHGFDGVSVCTDVDFGSAGGKQFRYWHLLVAGENAQDVGLVSDRVLLSHISVFNLVGMWTTQWRCLQDPDVPEAAGLLAQLCTDFLTAVPGILDSARQEQERLDAEAHEHLH